MEVLPCNFWCTEEVNSLPPYQAILELQGTKNTLKTNNSSDLLNHFKKSTYFASRGGEKKKKEVLALENVCSGVTPAPKDLGQH